MFKKADNQSIELEKKVAELYKITKVKKTFSSKEYYAKKIEDKLKETVTDLVDLGVVLPENSKYFVELKEVPAGGSPWVYKEMVERYIKSHPKSIDSFGKLKEKIEKELVERLYYGLKKELKK